LRAFDRWSERLSEEAGLTHAQHQLLVAIRGHRGAEGPAISDVARYLMVRHHSAIGLINRAEAAGLVKRQADKQDRRVVRLALTRSGFDRVEALASLHLEELRRLAPLLAVLLGGEK
jgi:DNA-binding MarR family transcriptional regulator